MPKWTGKTKGSLLGHKIFLLTLRYFGLTPAYFLLRFVALHFFFFTDKKHILYYFHNILGYGYIKSYISIYRNFYIFGQILIDKTAILSGYYKKFTFDFDGEEYLRQMKNGGILIGAHIGNWEVSGQLLERLNTTINILVYDAEHQKIKEYLSTVEVNRNMHFIVIKDDYSHIYEVKEALARGELIAMHADRYTDNSKTEVLNFMNKDAKFPSGPFYLAAKYHVPISFTFAMKESKHHYHFYASPHYYIKEGVRTKGSGENIRNVMKEYVTTLENKIKTYPIHWFNYFDFWETGDNK